MNQRHPEELAQHAPANINAAPRQGRRKLIQAGVAGAPVLLALKSTPVLAGNCKHPSGFSVSGNLSATGGKNCASPLPKPSAWQQADTWPGGLDKNTAVFNAYLTAPAIGHDGDADTFKLLDALGDTTNPLNAKAAAVFLGALSTGSPTSTEVALMWKNGVRGGAYNTRGYKGENSTWGAMQVETYFDYLLGLNPP